MFGRTKSVSGIVIQTKIAALKIIRRVSNFGKQVEYYFDSYTSFSNAKTTIRLASEH